MFHDGASTKEKRKILFVSADNVELRDVLIDPEHFNDIHSFFYFTADGYLTNKEEQKV